MLRLEMFSGLNLSQPAGTAPPQKRRLALFALLALAGDRGISREKIVGYLWPESPADDARHSLEQLIYGTRRAIGESVILGGTPVSLNPDVISSDVRDFEQAISAGEIEKAVELYHGPFLDGFFLNDSPEFERWTSGERRRLADLQAKALEELAARASTKGDRQSAVDSLRKRAALDPLSARGALLLMRALAESGDRTSALRHAALYEDLIRQELDSNPDPAVKAFAAELRSGAPSVATAPVAPPAPLQAPRQSHDAAFTERSAPIASPPQSGAHRSRKILTLAAFAAIVAMIAVAIVSRIGRIADERKDSSAPSRIVVLPFRVSARDTSLTYLGEGMVDLLSARFTGEGGPIAVDPRAVMSAWRRISAEPSERNVRDIAAALRASEIIAGEVVQTSATQLTLNGRVMTAESGRVLAQETVRGPTDSIAALGDRLAARLLAGRSGEEHQRMPSLITTSNTALTAFLQGRSEYRRGHIGAARRYFGRALDEDSTFAPAALELTLATGRVFQWNTVNIDTVRQTRGIALGGTATSGSQDEWERGIRIATREVARLDARDRTLLAALSGGYPRPTAARTVLKNWEKAAELFPDGADAQFWLGQVLLTQGPALGLADSRSRAAANFRRALDIDSGFVGPLEGLIEIAAFDRDTVTLDRLSRLYHARDSTSDEAVYVAWRVAGIKGDEAALDEIRPRLRALDVLTLDRIRLISQLDGVALGDAKTSISLIASRAGQARERQLALHSARQLALNQGRPMEAVRLARAKREVEPNDDLARGYAIRDALFWGGDTITAKSAVVAFEADLAQSSRDGSPDNRRRSSYWRFSAALWRLWRGDTSRVATDIAKLRTGTQREEQAQLLDALLISIIGRADAGQSLARLDSLALLGFGTTPHVINLVSARIHERRGDLPGALAAIRRGIWYFPPENLSTYLREEGRLAALTGDRKGAIRAWRHYLALRANPEPSVRPEVERIRASLTQLTNAR